MRPVMGNFTVSSDNGFLHWNSPTPFVFAGLAVILGIIAVALFVLSCLQFRGDSQQDSRKDESLAAGKTAGVDEDVQMHIIVIMPGEDEPRHLAKPSTATFLCTCS
ncbi:hypothetical protein QQ045_033639 [Rhodiola kirilowii]